MWERIKQLLGIGKNEARHEAIDNYQAKKIILERQAKQYREKSESVASNAKRIEDKVMRDYFRVASGGNR